MHLHWKLLKILWTYLQHTNTIRWPKIRLELRKKKKKSGPSNSRENIQETEAIQPLLSRWRLPSNCLNQHVGLSTKFTKAEKSKSEGSKQFQTKLNVYKKSLALFKLFFLFLNLSVKTTTLLSSATWIWFCHGSLFYVSPLNYIQQEDTLTCLDYTELVFLPLI